MHSISKTTVARDDAERIIHAVFGERVAIRVFEELTDGYFNAAYTITLTDGRTCVLKVAPPADVQVLTYEHGIMHAEVEIMRLVKQRTSVPVPAIYAFDDTRQLLASPFYLMEFVHGVALNKLRDSLAPHTLNNIERTVGEYLRQVNTITGPSFGYAVPAAPRHTSWRAAFLQMIDGVFADGQALDVMLPLPYNVLRAQVALHAAALDEISTPRLVHWDLWDGNIFIDPASEQITGIIDWERALWGDPLMEYQFRTLAPSEAFAAGYGQAMLTGHGTQQRRVLYNIYLYLIMIIECFYRQFDTHTQERWARQQLAQELARLETLKSDFKISDGR